MRRKKKTSLSEYLSGDEISSVVCIDSISKYNIKDVHDAETRKLEAHYVAAATGPTERQRIVRVFGWRQL